MVLVNIVQEDKDQYRILKAQHRVNKTGQTNANNSNQSLRIRRKDFILYMRLDEIGSANLSGSGCNFWIISRPVFILRIWCFSTTFHRIYPLVLRTIRLALINHRNPIQATHGDCGTVGLTRTAIRTVYWFAKPLFQERGVVGDPSGTSRKVETL